MNCNDFNTLFYSICEIKEIVVKLKSNELKDVKKQFFEMNFPEWRLQLLWEFIWDDKTFDDVYRIFSEKKLIEKRGDIDEKRQS